MHFYTEVNPDKVETQIYTENQEKGRISPNSFSCTGTKVLRSPWKSLLRSSKQHRVQGGSTDIQKDELSQVPRLVGRGAWWLQDPQAGRTWQATPRARPFSTAQPSAPNFAAGPSSLMPRAAHHGGECRSDPGTAHLARLLPEVLLSSGHWALHSCRS